MSIFTVGDPLPGRDLIQEAMRLRRLADDLEAIHRDSRPPRGTLRDVPMIADWRVVTRPAPCLSGVVTGHPDIVAGRPAVTSQVWVLDPRRGYARTTSRLYRLGGRRK